MAKMIKYKFLSAGNIVLEKAMQWSVANEAIAQREACNGEYIIEDDGVQEEPVKPTDAERIAALEEQLAAAKILLGVE